MIFSKFASDMIAWNDMRGLLATLITLFAATVGWAGSFTMFSPSISNYWVNFIAEDADGYIWFATRGGLNRYNGTDFAVVLASDDSLSLRDNNVTCVEADDDGTLWVASISSIGLWRDGRFEKVVPSRFFYVLRMMDLGNGTMLFTTNDGLYVVDKQSLEVVSSVVDGDLGFCRELAITPQGEIWVIPQSRQVILAFDKGLRRTKEISVEDVGSLLGLMADSEGVVWVNGFNSVAVADPATGEVKPASESILSALRGKTLMFAHPYGAGKIIFGCLNDGIYVYDKAENTMDKVFSESSWYSYSMVDSHLNLWLSDAVSFKVLPHAARYRNISLDGKLNFGNIFQGDIDGEGRLYVISGIDILSVDPQTEEALWSYVSAWHNSLTVTSTGELCVARSSELLRYDIRGGAPRLIGSEQCESTIYRTAEAHDGTLWLLLDNKIVKIRPDGGREDVYSPEGSVISDMAATRGSSEVYVVTVGKGTDVYCTDGRIRHVDAPSGSVTCLLRSTDGTYWAGTDRGELMHLDGELSPMGEALTGGFHEIRDILQDNEGRIWFCTTVDIHCHDPASGKCTAIHDAAYSSGKMYPPHCGARDGAKDVLYFCGPGGVTVVDPAVACLPAEDTELKLDYVLVNWEQRLPEAGGGLSLRHKDKVLTISYAGLEYSDGGSQSYAYRLVGFDKDWTEAAGKMVTYTNLPRGKYVFRVRVCNSDGNWSSSELSLPIRVRPAPLACNAALLCYAVALLALVGMAVSRRTKSQVIRVRNQRDIAGMTSSTLSEKVGQETVMSPAEKAFLSRIDALMDEHLADEGFGIQELAAAMNMSYSTLYAKVKGLTGKTPQEFQRGYRLNIALELLQKVDMNVSEVGYATGFSSLSNFSKNFKAQFGYPPSQVHRA